MTTKEIEGIIIGFTNDKYKIPFKINKKDEPLLRYKWYAHKRSGRNYLESIIRTYRIKNKRKNKTLHNEILDENVDDGYVIDHINGDVTDNTRGNLRIITDAENRKASKNIRLQVVSYAGI
jgi:hypothetical protein